MTRVALVAGSPFPYTTAILNELVRNVDLNVVYARASDPDYGFVDAFGDEPLFPFRFLLGPSSGPARPSPLAAGRLWRVLRELHPEVVVVISWGPLAISTILWKVVARRRSVMWSESTRQSGRHRDIASQTVRRTIIRATDAFVTNGSQATGFVADLGASPRRIVTGCLPSGLLVSLSQRRDPGPRFLFVGRLIESKHPEWVVRGFRKVLDVRHDATLMIVGGGPLESVVRDEAAGIGDRVQFLGRLEGAALSAAYTHADVLVLPADREVWGLVVNEGLEAGLFVIATDGVGSAYDLLDVDSGLRVAPREQAITAAMVAAATDVDLSPAARAKRRTRVAKCTPRRFSDSMLVAINIAATR